MKRVQLSLAYRIYRKPLSNLTQFYEDFQSLLTLYCSRKHMYVLGGYNINLLDDYNNDFLALAHYLCLVPAIDKPTRIIIIIVLPSSITFLLISLEIN